MKIQDFKKVSLLLDKREELRQATDYVQALRHSCDEIGCTIVVGTRPVVIQISSEHVLESLEKHWGSIHSQLLKLGVEA